MKKIILIIISILVLSIVYAQQIGQNLTQEQIDNMDFKNVNLQCQYKGGEARPEFVIRPDRVNFDLRIGTPFRCLSFDPWHNNQTGEKEYTLIIAQFFPYFTATEYISINKTKGKQYTHQYLKQELIDQRQDMDGDHRKRLSSYQTQIFPNINWTAIFD